MTIIKAVSGYLMYPQISTVTYYSPPPPIDWKKKREGWGGVGWGGGGGTTQKKKKKNKGRKHPGSATGKHSLPNCSRTQRRPNVNQAPKFHLSLHLWGLTANLKSASRLVAVNFVTLLLKY